MKPIIHEKIFFNNQILSADNVSLSAISSAALYGKGVFTTLAIYNAKPFLWEKHWERLTENAKKIGIDLTGFSEGRVKNSLHEIISKNKITNARARITFFDETASGVWNFSTARKTSILITTGDFRAAPEVFRLTISPFSINSTSLLAGIKSCNYLENLLALEDAKARNFDEAIRLNERGEIVSACLANVFWIKNEKIYTPSPDTGCLKGTTRSYVVENFEIAESRATIEELNRAEDIFLTSAGFGIRRVLRFDEMNFSNPSKIFLDLKNCLFN